MYSSFNDERNATLHADLRLGLSRYPASAKADSTGKVPDVKGVSLPRSIGEISRVLATP